MSETRLIKRYLNRKLYDTENSCYVTLDEIGAIIRDGIDIKVIDNKTKADITYSIQLRVLFNQESKEIDTNIKLLNRVIKKKGTFTSYINDLENEINLDSWR